MSSSNMRLLISALVAFSFYFAWAYWANLSDAIPLNTTIQAAFVQGAYSGLMTLLFTWLLERSVSKFHGHCFSLAFMMPILCKFHSTSTQNQAIKKALSHGLNESARFFEGQKLPGALLAPLLPLLIQSGLVTLVNVINQTPNLWLTVAPSIIFSGIYGYSYTTALIRTKN